MDIDELILAMTLEEKVSFCSGADDWHTRSVNRLGIPSLRMTDGPHGTRVTYEYKKGEPQKSKPATCYPTGSALAATWNEELIQRVGVALGEETRTQGCDILLGPAVNIHRTPLGGRNFEYYSEDPFLSGRMAVRYIRGLQTQRVGASIKHFACNNSEFERWTISSEVTERAFREIYLPAFEAAVTEAQPWTVMCSYNKINGVYSSENKRLLSDILKDEWGFEGFVVSDWGAVHNRVAAANSGLDLEMPGPGEEAVDELLLAVRQGLVGEERINEVVRRILKTVAKARLFDMPKEEIVGVSNTLEHRKLAREVAEEAIVLLKNETGFLPLDEKKVKSIGVMGPNAATASIQGGGSAQVNPYYAISPLEGLKNRCGEAIRIIYVEGCSVIDPNSDEKNRDNSAKKMLEQAIKVASEVDVVIVCAGLTWEQESEGFDRRDMNIPEGQVTLIKEVAKVNPNTIVVLNNGSALEMASWIEPVGAVIEAWFTGEESGNALAGILFGDVNPSGKLPETFPEKYEDTPAFINYPGENGEVMYGEGIFVGYRYYDKKKVKPLFPFGYGLSYTSFEYSKLVVSPSITGKGEIEVSLDIRNIGELAGKEVVQVYVNDVESSLIRPPQELKGFKKVNLESGQLKTIRFKLIPRDFAYYNPGKKAWVAEAGEFEILVGSSSRDIRLKGVTRIEKDELITK